MRCSSPNCSARVRLSGQALPCPYCKKCFCGGHRLPESHTCPNLEEGLKNKWANQREVKPKFVNHIRQGGVGA